MDRPYEGGFVGNTHRFALRVYFEDTDVAGMVYYANYLRFMERARSDILRALDIDQRASMEGGEGTYAVVDVSIRYRAPGKLGDDLLVLSKVKYVRAASCVIHQQVRRGEEVLTDATVTAAFLSPDGHPKRQPKEWLQKFERLKGDLGQ